MLAEPPRVTEVGFRLLRVLKFTALPRALFAACACERAERSERQSQNHTRKAKIPRLPR